MTNFSIKVVSDAVCPWCYLGKARLERAISLYKSSVPGGADDTFTVSWHPFYLDPTLPKTSVDHQTWMAPKFAPDHLAMIQARLRAFGQGEGINFSFNSRVGNTRDAHRLVQLAKTKSNETENKVISALFKSHFEEDGDITSFDMLVAAGEKGGLDGAEVRGWLESGQGGEEVDKEVLEANRKGIHGVPNFTINDMYDMSGAQDPQTFLERFVRIKKSAPDVSKISSEGVSC